MKGKFAIVNLYLPNCQIVPSQSVQPRTQTKSLATSDNEMHERVDKINNMRVLFWKGSSATNTVLKIKS